VDEVVFEHRTSWFKVQARAGNSINRFLISVKPYGVVVKGWRLPFVS